VECVKYALCSVTPTLLQAKLLEPNADHGGIQAVNTFASSTKVKWQGQFIDESPMVEL
jgi:hypothetical protein